MEKFDNFCHEELCKKLQNETYLPKTAFRSLENVNALHQTVVTLRKSLEEAKLEINSLKSQIAVNDSIEEGKLYRCQDNLSNLNEPKNKYSDCLENSKNCENCETSTIFIVDNESEISRCKNQQSKIDIFQNGDALDQPIRSFIESETLENILKKRYTRMAANMDVKIRWTSSFSLGDRKNHSNSTSDNNLVENLTPIHKEDESLSTLPTNNTDISEEIQAGRNLNSADKHIQVRLGEESGAVGGSDDSDECLIDDIEVIFSSGGKQYPQDDLVSLSFCEPWQICGQSGTPVLIKFHSISEIEGFHDSTTKRNELSSSLSSITNSHLYNSVDQCIHSEKCIHGDEMNRYYDLRKQLSNSNEVIKHHNVLKNDHKFKIEPVQLTYTNAKNYEILPEKDISKIGVINDNEDEQCGIYRPLIHRNALGIFFKKGGKKNVSTTRKLTAIKFAPNESPSNHCHGYRENDKENSKRSISAQTDISALPGHWRSDSHLLRGIFKNGVFTLPSKFTKWPGNDISNQLLKVSEIDHEGRRVLLSDIKFTSMVPEISRSADHLCHVEGGQNSDRSKKELEETRHVTSTYSCSSVTPIVRSTSPELSHCNVELKRFGIPDSHPSSKKHGRSRSCPSKICKHRSNCGKLDRSRIFFKESKSIPLLGSLPNILKSTCKCYFNRTEGFCDDSCGSTESLLDEAENYLHELVDKHLFTEKKHKNSSEHVLNQIHERFAENELRCDFIPPVQSSPFLPTTAKCLKTGYLAKVITKNGRLVIGRIRYIGPLVNGALKNQDKDCEIFVGLQLRTKAGECDGSFEGRKIFDCEPRQGLFVPFKKVVMAWKT